MTQLGKLQVDLEMDSSKFSKSVKDSVRALEQFNAAANKMDIALKLAEEDLKKSAKAAKVLDKELERNKNQTQSFAKALKGTATELNSVWSIAQRVTGTITTLYSAMADGARTLDAAQFFQNAGKDIDAYRRATGGLLSDAKVMKKSNLADAMGISGDQFQKFSQIAYASALKSGQSFEHMFDSIVVGSARSSRLLLDNLGIIVSAKSANADYAASIGKTVEELTAEEKQLAFINAAVAAGSKAVEELKGITESTAAVYDGLAASAENAADSIKKNMAQAGKGMATFLTDLTQMIADLPPQTQMVLFGSGIAGGAAGAGLAVAGGLGLAPAAVIGGLTALGAGSYIADKQLANDEFWRGMARDREAQLSSEISGYAPDIMGLARTGAGKDDKNKTVMETVLGMSKDELQELADRYGESGQYTVELIDELRELRKAQEKLGIPVAPMKVARAAGETFGTSETGPSEEALKAARKLAETWEKGLSGWSTITEETWWEHERQLEEAAQKVADAETDARIESFHRVTEQMQKEAANRKKINETILALQEQEYAKGKQLTTDPQGFLRDQIENLFKPREGDMISVFREGLLDVMTGIDMGEGINLQGGLKPIFDTFDSLGITSAAVDGAMMGLADAALGAATGGISMLMSAISSIAQAAIDLVMQIVQANPFLQRAQEGMGLVFEAVSRQFDPVMRGVEQMVGVLLYFFDVVGSETDGFTLLKDVVSGLVSAFIGLHASLLEMRAAMLSFYIQLDDMGIDVMSDEDKEQNRRRVTRYQARADEMRRMDGPDFQNYLESRLEENADVVAENTKAVRDLAREFKNLPSGYKIAGADFATSRGTPRPVVGGVLSGDAASWANQRAGDAYRWRR